MIPRTYTSPVPLYRHFLVVLMCVALILSAAACAKRSHTPQTTGASPAGSQRININTASVKELEALPGIGEGLARRIVEHRRRYGPFQRSEHLMMVRGISDARFHAVRHLITVE